MARCWWLAIVTLAAAIIVGPFEVHAQESAPPLLDDASRHELVKAAADALRQRYIFPDVGNRAADTLEKALAAGEYDEIVEPADFAQRLTDQLFGVMNDKHVSITASGSRLSRRAAVSAMPFEFARDEGGIIRADLLANDIGYIEIDGFPDLALFQPPLDRAMATLAKTRALIIDARRHTGGGASSEAYFASYFVKGKHSFAVDKFVWRNGGTETYTVEEFRSSQTPFRYKGRRMYVLTSGHTFSAGEALAYDLHALGLVKIIGEQTGGGGNPGRSVPLTPGYSMWLSTGRAENPITGKNWEGVGVTPDIRVPASDALKVALEKLGVKTDHTRIADLSKTQVFAPRTTPQPGSEAAVRRLAEELGRGEPSYDFITNSQVQGLRERWKTLHDRLAPLGEVQSIKFRDIDVHGSARFDVQYANEALVWSIALDKDGKVASFRMTGSAPVSQ